MLGSGKLVISAPWLAIFFYIVLHCRYVPELSHSPTCHGIMRATQNRLTVTVNNDKSLARWRLAEKPEPLTNHIIAMTIDPATTAVIKRFSSTACKRSPLARADIHLPLPQAGQSDPTIAFIGQFGN
jgi:hypothetical protein